MDTRNIQRGRIIGILKVMGVITTINTARVET